ncbi:hypothetical protein [Rhizobium sp. NZLR11]|uniref:phage adaptor protein n=1 Tax=Rhizobium sp. NZLR11 TaxID=2731098 RepID=UPI001C83168B|nr:hypothetical protein [Rhizobium sp. NZLR11]MBX5206690.1 hypothetical protein [Rhizobium sp. NZLR11]
MNILEITQAVCKNVGLDVPDNAVANTDREYVELVQFAKETGDECARRVDWAALRATATITGTGSNDDFALPAGFARLTIGNAVSVAGAPVRGGISQDEWFSLTPIQGTPRYCRINGTASISFYPYPALGQAVSLSYVTKNWCSNGTALWNSDSDTPLVPDDLITKGTIWRFKRKSGQDFSDYLAEFEAVLTDLAGTDMRERSPWQ